MKRFEAFGIVLIICAWSILSLHCIGSRDLWSAGETREAEIAQEMIDTGDFIVPRFNGEFLAWKPPLFHWSESLASLLTGKKVNSFSSRLPSSLSYLAGALFIFLLLKGLAGKKIRLLSSLVYLSAFKLTWMSRVAQIDVMFSVLIGTAYLVFFRFYCLEDSLSSRNKTALLFAFYISSALSVLAKGPAGAVLIAGGILLFLILERNVRFIRKLFDVRGLAVFVVISGSWYTAITLVEGKDFAYEFFINQNINRFVKAFDHQHPATYYISQFAGGFMPWTFFFLSALVSFFSLQKPVPKIYLFFLSCFLFVFIFFSLSSSKRGVYILPLYLPAGILTGFFMERACREKFPSFLFRLAGLINALLIFTFSFLVIALRSHSLQSRLYALIEPRLSEFDRIMYAEIQPFIEKNMILLFILSVLLTASAVILIVLLARKKVLSFFGLQLFLVLLLITFGIHAIMPLLDRHRSLRPFAEKVDSALAENETVYSYRIGNEDLVFYSKRAVVPLDDLSSAAPTAVKKGRPLYIFTDRKYLSEVKKLYCDYRVLFDTGIRQIDGVLVKVER